MSTLPQPWTASIAAEPVSPLVAPTIVTRSPRAAEHVVEHPPDELQGDVLERQRRAVEQLGQPLPVVDLHERHDGRVAERGVGVVAHPPQSSAGDLVADERGDDAVGDLGVAARPRRARSAAAAAATRPARTARRRSASPASSTSAKPSSGARPRVETYVARRSGRR